MRNPKPNHAIDRRRSAHRDTRVGAQTHHRKIGRHGDAGAAGRSTRCVGSVVGVADVAGRARIDAVEAAVGEFRERGLGDQNAAGLANAFDGRGVALWLKARQRCRAARRRQIAGVDVVLGDEGNAVQRAAEFAGGLELGIERIGLGQRLSVDRDDGVQHRPLLVIRLDACEVGRGHLVRRGLAAEISRVNLFDRRLLDREVREGSSNRGYCDGNDQPTSALRRNRAAWAHG
jgi:hypothetical protein